MPDLLNESAWDVVSASLLIAFFSVFAIKLARRLGLSPRWAISLYFWHLMFGLIFFRISSGGGFDAANYYIASLGELSPFKFGTQAVIHLTSFFSKGLNLSYLSVTIAFNFFGFAALLIWSSVLFSITSGKTRPVRIFSIMFLLLPGIHFWHAGIGKDVLTFLGTAIVSYALYRAKHLWGFMALGLGLVFLARPHIAGLLILGIFVYLMMNRRLNAVYQLLFFSVTAAVALAIFQFLNTYLGFEENVEISDIYLYIEGRQNYNMEGSVSINITSMSIPERLFTYLFRPFPLEAPGLMGLIVGLENVFLLLLFTLILPRAVIGRNSGDFEFRRFALFFGLLCLLVFANTTANLGIALRQKWMFLPLLFVYVISTAKKIR